MADERRTEQDQDDDTLLGQTEKALGVEADDDADVEQRLEPPDIPG